MKQREIKDEIDVEIPDYLKDDRIPWMKWVKYKGETCVADIDFMKSIKAHRPIVNIHYCMTEAYNGIILQTVNFVPEHFTKSELA
jgi:hypothetical protein